MIQFTLRKFRFSDTESLRKHADNERVARFLTNQFPHPYSLRDAEEFITCVMNDNPAKIFAIVINEEVAGSIGITPQYDVHCKNMELGYWLAECYWGQGIMPRVIAQVVDYAFRTYDITRIFARPFGNNKSSQRVLEKAGFIREACFEKAIYKNGEYQDELYYGLRRER